MWAPASWSTTNKSRDTHALKGLYEQSDVQIEVGELLTTLVD